MESAGSRVIRNDDDDGGSSQIDPEPRSPAPFKLERHFNSPPGHGNLRDLQRMIDGLPESIAVLDVDGTIVASNKAWQQVIARLHMDELIPGGNYRDYCVDHAAGNPDALAVIAGIDDVAAGRIEQVRHLYAATPLTNGHDYQVCISALEFAGQRLLFCVNYDVTSERQLKQQCRGLERSLLRIQTLERQRIGRDLHDSTAQQLVVLRLSLIRLKQMQFDAAAAPVLADIEDALDQMNHEIRAISYLLHPPSLESANLVDAIDAMVKGFARRTNLDITFTFEGRLAHWDRVQEAALYRLAQEALANVQRHAQASQARIRLVARPSKYLHLIIEDNGIGIRASRAQTSLEMGVGLTGMEARIDELGGRFHIERCPHGTRIVASLRAEYDEGRVDRRAPAERRRPAMKVHDPAMQGLAILAGTGEMKPGLGQPKRRKHQDLE